MKCDVCEQVMDDHYMIEIVRWAEYSKPEYVIKLDVCGDCAKKYATLIRKEVCGDLQKAWEK